MEGQIEEKYCPTQNGLFTGYRPEWRFLGKKEWREIPVKVGKGVGVLFPSAFGGVLRTIWLFGYSQASAFAWKWKAISEFEGKQIEIRLKEFEVVYDIKAKEVGIINLEEPHVIIDIDTEEDK